MGGSSEPPINLIYRARGDLALKNIEPPITVLRREQLLIDHAPHNVQSQDPTDRLLCTLSAVAALQLLLALVFQQCTMLALDCFARNVGTTPTDVYPSAG